ncbi:MAG TPA: FAD binding domain-containing protein, partial [Rectinemataceae bacterium]
MNVGKIFVNDRWVEPQSGPGTPALDFIRGEMGLKGAKEGCREGDCGACAVLVGEIIDPLGAGSEAGTGPERGAGSGFRSNEARFRYRALPSCLLALGELEGKHLITIEGLSGGYGQDKQERHDGGIEGGGRDMQGGAQEASPNLVGLSPVMRAFLEENASQCGFCSPGFIISLTAWLCAPGQKDIEGALRAVDGNLCRCTGYGSIRRAAARLCSEFADLPQAPLERLEALVEAEAMPRSALDYIGQAHGERGSAAAESDPGEERDQPDGTLRRAIGGGTDFYVRNPYPEAGFSPRLVGKESGLKTWSREEGDDGPWLRLGAAMSVSDFFALPPVLELYPALRSIEGEFASTLVRNLATIGGNIANASPVGDLSCLFMGLGARLELGGSGGGTRRIRIEDFFVDYKKTASAPGEIIKAILLPARPGLAFSFSKIAKRRSLDIAAVNSTLAFRIKDGRIREPRLSAGGVGPIPLLLKRSAA